MKRKHAFYFIAIFLLVAACAGIAPKTPASLDTLLHERKYVQGEEVRDIKNYRISGWQSLDDQHIIINTGPSMNYLVTLSYPCSEIKFTEVIALTSTIDQVSKFETLLVSDSAGFVRRCPIITIHKLAKIDKKNKSVAE